MKSKYYVVNVDKGYVSHESDDDQSCRDYVNACVYQWGHKWKTYAIVHGSKAVNDLLKGSR